MSEQFKKTEKGLACCERRGYCEGHCPYYEPEKEALECTSELAHDALALISHLDERIKELSLMQTARVLKLRELYEGQVIWFEGFRSEGYRSLWVAEVSKVCSDEIVFFGGNNEVHMPIHAYEERYRCWTQRPTFKKREATQWAK